MTLFTTSTAEMPSAHYSCTLWLIPITMMENSGNQDHPCDGCHGNLYALVHGNDSRPPCQDSLHSPLVYSGSQSADAVFLSASLFFSIYAAVILNVLYASSAILLWTFFFLPDVPVSQVLYIQPSGLKIFFICIPGQLDNLLKSIITHLIWYTSDFAKASCT